MKCMNLAYKAVSEGSYKKQPSYKRTAHYYQNVTTSEQHYHAVKKLRADKKEIAIDKRRATGMCFVAKEPPSI